MSSPRPAGPGPERRSDRDRARRGAAASSVRLAIRSKRLPAKTRRDRHQEIASGAIIALALHPMVRNVFADAARAIRRAPGFRRSLWAKTASGWKSAVSPRFLMSIVRDRRAKLRRRFRTCRRRCSEVHRPAGYRYPAARICSDGSAPWRCRQPAQEIQPGQAGTLVEEILGRQVAKPEILPPNGLVFPAVPIQHERKKPARLLLRRVRSATSSGTPFVSRATSAGDLLLPLAELFADLHGLRNAAARSTAPLGDETRLARASSQSRKRCGGSAVIPIVALIAALSPPECRRHPPFQAAPASVP